jgi:hypothetical protein
MKEHDGAGAPDARSGSNVGMPFSFATGAVRREAASRRYERRAVLFVAMTVVVLVGCHGDRETRRLKSRHQRASNPAASPSAAASPRETRERDVDRLVLAWLQANAHPNADEIVDALPNATFWLTVSRDPGSQVWDKALVDLDRDGKVDEKWWLTAGGPGKKRVSTSDDGHFDREERWRDGRWVGKRGQR